MTSRDIRVMRLVLPLIAVVSLWPLGCGSASSPSADNATDRTEGWTKLQRAAQKDRPPNGSASAMRRAYAVMRTPPEPMPAQLATHTFRTLDAPSHALDFDDAQYAVTPPGALWIVTGQDVACIVQAGPGAVTCGTVSNVVQDGLVISIGTGRPTNPIENQGVSPPQRFEVLGLAPDSARSVEIKVGRRTHTRPVRGNTYSVQAKQIALVKRLIP